MANRGTLEGDIQEIEFVKKYNKDKNNPSFSIYNRQFGCFDLENIFLCRVTTKQYSSLSKQVVMTRADAYAILVEQDISDLLIKNDFYIDENILKSNNIEYNFIEKSGISIKLSNSKKFQILKLTPNSFKALFSYKELGAGASLYCKKDYELAKNPDVITGWHCSTEDMCEFFKDFNIDCDFVSDIEMCKKIKTHSERKIKSIIDDSDELKAKIFKGIGLYAEPYCAHYIYKEGRLDILDYIPFQITTGSGRSKGIYTIVLKP